MPNFRPPAALVIDLGRKGMMTQEVNADTVWSAIAALAPVVPLEATWYIVRHGPLPTDDDSTAASYEPVP